MQDYCCVSVTDTCGFFPTRKLPESVEDSRELGVPSASVRLMCEFPDASTCRRPTYTNTPKLAIDDGKSVPTHLSYSSEIHSFLVLFNSF